DAERTERAFLPDPHRPGQRMYRSGDYGRWLEGGKLEFLGRRDAQVKVRGFRIEIGEIESRLLSLPGVRGAAVVVTGGAGGGRQLVAFYCGSHPPGPAAVRRALAATLPAYMVPSAVHRLAAMPLTDNGKLDRKSLGLLAAVPAETPREGPRTATEH